MFFAIFSKTEVLFNMYLLAIGCTDLTLENIYSDSLLPVFLSLVQVIIVIRLFQFIETLLSFFAPSYPLDSTFKKFVFD